MSTSEFAAYVEGLPPQDRITVEQALTGLRQVLVGATVSGAEHDDVLELIDMVRGTSHG